jgi:deoxyribodipyrimidine photo-lyase
MLLIAGVLWPLIWSGFALIYASTITWRLPPPAAIRMPACWRCLSPRRGSGVSTVWRRGRRLLSSAICVACSQALAERGIALQVAEAEDFSASVQLLTDYCAQQQVSHLFYNYQYEINERQRDAAVENG